jgi:hypothetical protein
MERVINGIVAGPALINQEQCTSLILNEGNLSSEQRQGLFTGGKRIASRAKEKFTRIARSAKKEKKRQKGLNGTKSTETP